MKKLLPFLSAVILVAACNQKPDLLAGSSGVDPMEQAQPLTDTAGLASFRAWKVQNELTDLREYQAEQPAAAPVKKQSPRKTTPSQPRQSQPAATPSSNSSDNSTSAGNEAPAPVAEKKEGWSKAAKGAVIGGVAGAAGGAVINKKNRVVGAVIGAVIGAGGGYVVGRQMDKKDGRIELN